MSVKRQIIALLFALATFNGANRLSFGFLASLTPLAALGMPLKGGITLLFFSMAMVYRNGATGSRV